MARNNYTAIYEYDAEDDYWLVHLKEEPGCHTFGKSIRQARSELRDAMDAWDIDPNAVELSETFDVPGAPKYVAEYLEERERFEQAQAALSKLGGRAVQHLRKRGFSMRDTAEILGISHQRVAQLEASASHGEIRGMKVVVTGKFAQWHKKEMTDALEALGADVTRTFSGKTQLLVVGTKAGSKLAQAKKLGVPVIGEGEMEQLLAGASLTKVLKGRKAGKLGPAKTVARKKRPKKKAASN